MIKTYNIISKGYKKSPIGIIPNEWEIQKLENLVSKISNGLIYDVNQTLGAPVTRIETISSGKINMLKVGYTYASDKIKDYKLEKGDILYSHINSLSQIGKIAFFDKDITLYHGMNLLRIRPNSRIINKFLYYLLLTPYAKHIAQVIAKPAVNQASISISDLKKICLITPTISEQKRITEILSLWDKAIEKQSRLITLLELRKKGLMQQLLTSKKRLCGFNGEWEICKLSEICKRVVRKNSEGDTNVMTISAQQGFVKQTDFFNKSVASESIDGYFLVKEDEFCYNKSYSNGYPMGAIKRLKEAEKAVVTTLYICFKVIDEKTTDINFLEQLFNIGILNKGLTKVANEGGRAHGLLNVTPRDFFELKINIPTIEEQKSISKIIKAIDKEIEVEKNKFKFFCNQKTGLMQQLLTGKIRVK